MSDRHTLKLGSRSPDLLHVAAALVLDAKIFFSFDDRQRKAVASEGLTLKLWTSPRKAACDGVELPEAWLESSGGQPVKTLLDLVCEFAGHSCPALFAERPGRATGKSPEPADKNVCVTGRQSSD